MAVNSPLIADITNLSEQTIIPPNFVRDISEQPNVTFNEFRGEVPVISLARIDNVEERAKICEEIEKACKGWGFFQVVDHGVALELIRNMIRCSEDFFALPHGEKSRFGPSGSNNKGGFATSSNLKGEAVKDWREKATFYCHPPHHKDYSSWPDKPQEWRATIEEYSDQLMILTKKIIALLSDCLGLKGDNALIKACLENDNAVQKILVNYYPKCPQPQLALGLKRHTDSGIITLLYQHQVSGLQVTNNNGGIWFTVPPVEGAFVVNVGDSLHILSNGRLKKADHRVVVNAACHRLSIATFLDPSPKAKLRPLGLKNGEKPIIQDPIIYEEMYREKMEKHLASDDKLKKVE